MSDQCPSDAKVCPGCQTYVQRISGCPRVQCTVCKQYYCDGCGKGFGNDSGALNTHYSNTPSCQK